MEIARPHRQCTEQRGVIGEALGDQVHDLALAAQRADHAEQARVRRGVAVAALDPVPDDQVGAASLVLQRHEHRAVRAVGLLARDH
nr:hypothetical protein [Plasticicumulans lactativorans]